ncbi:LLM class F420-dependent oxidoreductase [soil metagenome]
MLVDTMLGSDLTTVGAQAAGIEAAGYAGGFTVETNHDPFFPLVLAAQQTRRIDLGTAIAVAFARSPMTLANVGWDLQTLTRGRFILGLGSQIKPHITKRFSMPWGHPAPRMRELILAVRAIWASWLDGTPLRFRGEFYTHSLMTPFFAPDPDDLAEVGPPRIFLAGVGEHMTEVAGEVADGFICHAFSTERYLRDVTVPALARGRAKVGQDLDGFEIVAPGFVVTGQDDAHAVAVATAIRQQIAFYGSTPAYRAVLDHHGWGDAQDELNTLSKAGRWDDMSGLVTDEMLSTFAVVAPPDQLGAAVRARYGDVATRLTFTPPSGDPDPERWRDVVHDLGLTG